MTILYLRGTGPAQARTLRNSLLAPPTVGVVQSPISLRIVFVVARKDLHLLESSIGLALNSLSNFTITRVTVITQHNLTSDVASRLSSLSASIEVLDEENLISEKSRILLKEKFKGRYGWSLQQFLKLQSALSCLDTPTLVIDSDTFLLKPRNWISAQEVQVLLPTEECHPQYYEFLKQLKMKVNQNYSFVAHHMIYQPRLLRECLSEIGVSSIEDLIKLVCSFPHKEGIESFFSLDYEMYAQFLLNYHPELCRFERWGNVEKNYSHEDLNLDQSLPGLMSVSAHSWKN
jgi:hypothetical protein